MFATISMCAFDLFAVFGGRLFSELPPEERVILYDPTHFIQLDLFVQKAELLLVNA